MINEAHVRAPRTLRGKYRIRVDGRSSFLHLTRGCAIAPWYRFDTVHKYGVKIPEIGNVLNLPWMSKESWGPTCILCPFPKRKAKADLWLTSVALRFQKKESGVAQRSQRFFRIWPMLLFPSHRSPHPHLIVINILSTFTEGTMIHLDASVVASRVVKDADACTNQLLAWRKR